MVDRGALLEAGITREGMKARVVVCFDNVLRHESLLVGNGVAYRGNTRTLSSYNLLVVMWRSSSGWDSLGKACSRCIHPPPEAFVDSHCNCPTVTVYLCHCVTAQARPSLLSTVDTGVHTFCFVFFFFFSGVRVTPLHHGCNPGIAWFTYWQVRPGGKTTAR